MIINYGCRFIDLFNQIASYHILLLPLVPWIGIVTKQLIYQLYLLILYLLSSEYVIHWGYWSYLFNLDIIIIIEDQKNVYILKLYLTP